MKTWPIRGGLVLLALLGVSSVISVFATVTTADAVYLLDRYEPRKLTGAKLGSMYRFVDGQLLGHPVCGLHIDESKLTMPTIADYRFTNMVGELLPYLAKLNRFLLGGTDGGEAVGTNQLFSLSWRATEIYLPPTARFEIDEACIGEVERLVQQGSAVCTIASVLVSKNVIGAPPYAVRFKEECVSYCPKSEVGPHTMAMQTCPGKALSVPKPSFTNVPFPTWVKVKLGFIDFNPVTEGPTQVGANQITE